MQNENRMTTQTYWEAFHTAKPRMRLPSTLLVSTRNLQRLLRRYISMGDKVLEIGFAPGKQLAYVANEYGAKVSGLDYSKSGTDFARELFGALGIDGDLRCEDVFSTSFPPNSFDVVYSVGVIEHFDDPSNIVRRHAELLRPGGTAIILIPDYQGLYGRIQRRLDPENLKIHNLSIMSPSALACLAPAGLVSDVATFHFGRIDPSQISLRKRFSPIIARLIYWSLTLLALIQPVDIRAVCPWIIMTMRRT
jgi:SAM-dependent methyltransferase